MNVYVSDPPGNASSPSSPAYQAELADALAALVGLTVPQIPAEAVAPAVYALYVQGLGYLERRDRTGNLELAVQLFDQAIAEAPDYALAHAGQCEATWELYRQENDPTLAEQARAACEEATRLAKDDPTVMVPLASVYLQSGQPAQAQATLERVLVIDPQHADAYHWLGLSGLAGL